MCSVFFLGERSKIMVLECLDIPVDLNHVYDHASQGRICRSWVEAKPYFPRGSPHVLSTKISGSCHAMIFQGTWTGYKTTPHIRTLMVKINNLTSDTTLLVVRYRKGCQWWQCCPTLVEVKCRAKKKKREDTARTKNGQAQQAKSKGNTQSATRQGE
ncbi:hypothetical protein GE21DRAFT_1256947 [Neurospora crassa]|nr:hypothetical protein GE21DRAFT_1256947 [Neurospora crassa]